MCNLAELTQYDELYHAVMVFNSETTIKWNEHQEALGRVANKHFL